ncbi:hypothetical protein V494_07351 [Pseudogymnoascus sp. VKM F-4513 (FW-928)]|nr:hypothetical protein V494_07351 [Pseudogymnoascus sp. VKM F-4513 (FW-928)]
MPNVLSDQINLQQVTSHSYTSSWHRDWTVGLSLHGGHVAAAVQLAAQTHFTTTLADQNQPDILTLHLDFIVACVSQAMQITVVDLKVGKGTSTIQLQVTQKDKVKVIATATSTNFSQSIGPTVKSDWAFHPPLKPAPNFEKVVAHKPDDNWLPTILAGEIGPFTRRQLTLIPREGYPIAGICDAWYTFPGDRIDTTCLTMMNDCMPSMSDTLLRNNGPYDAHEMFTSITAWTDKNPGAPAPLTNSFKDAAKATTFDISLTLDIQFKKRLPKEGLEWIFSRIATKMMQDGRMDVEVTLCDHNMDILCLSHQTMMVLDAQRKFTTRQKERL